jgi:hypothetical protein
MSDLLLIWLAAALVVVLFTVVLVALATLLARRGRPSGRGPQMGRDDTIGYFRDLSGRQPGPGVQEEDEPRRWGGDDNASR